MLPSLRRCACFRFRRAYVAMLFSGMALCQVFGQVVLNEMSSGAHQRDLHTTASGQVRLGSGPAWFEAGFVPVGGWLSGGLPFAFDTGPQAADLTARMQFRHPTLYLRHSFPVSSGLAASTGVLEFTIESRDGYAVWINGKEAWRRNCGTPGAFIYHDQHSFNKISHHTEVVHLGAASQWLVPGTNLLAVVHLNDSSIPGETRYQGFESAADRIYFSATAKVGTTAVSLSSAAWHYFIGMCEPSGGVVDPTDFSHATVQPEFTDWLELRNTTAEAVSLANWALTDEKGLPMKWRFPAGVSIPAHGYLLVLCSGRNANNMASGGYLHTNFSLSGSGEYVALVRPDGSVASSFQQVPDQVTRYSWGLPGTSALAAYLDPTPGSVNASAAALHGRVEKPLPSHETGYYATMPIFQASAGDPSSTVRYTVDGSDPVEASPIVPTTGGIPLPVSPGQPVLREIWEQVTSLDSAVFDTPATRKVLLAAAETTAVALENFVQRLRGYIVPSVTGSYRFYVAGNDAAELYVSTNASASNLQFQCSATTVPTRFWLQDGEQVSPAVTLIAGQRYYFEARGSCYGSENYLAVGWLRPGTSQPELLTSPYLAALSPLPGGISPTLIPHAVTVKIRGFASNKLPSEVVTRTLATGFNAATQAVPSVFLSGDTESVFYGTSGIFGLRGGVWIQDPGNPLDRVWSPANADADYHYGLVQGQAFERPATLELLLGNGILAGRTQAAARMAGSHFSRPHYHFDQLKSAPWAGDWRDKPQMNLFFRGYLGEKNFREKGLIPGSKLEQWEGFRLRSGRGGDNLTLVYDEHVRRTFHELGQPAVLGTPVHGFINGHHKAIFTLLERPREAWLQEYYETADPFLVRATDNLESGSAAEYNAMESALRTRDTSTLAGFQALAAQWDLNNVADYFMLNAWAASGDWIYPDGENNLVLFQRGGTDNRWRCSVWDADSSYGLEEHATNTNYTTTVLLAATQPLATDPSVLRTLFRRCYASTEFRHLFRNRVQRAFFNGGALSKPKLTASLNAAAASFSAVQTGLYGNPPSLAAAEAWIQNRETPLLTEWVNLGLWTNYKAPNISPASGNLASGQVVSLSNPNSNGSIYFTTNGSDPRAGGDAVAAGATIYNAGLSLTRPTTVQARVKNGTTWSPVITVHYAPAPPKVAISEIHYNPDGASDDLEFIELRNLSSQPAVLDLARFTAGITYQFPANTTLASGARLVLAKNATPFAAAYPGISPFGIFQGDLDNSGETVTLADAVGSVIATVAYGDDDTPGWEATAQADGKGRSLVLRRDGWGLTLTDFSAPHLWRAGFDAGGSPAGSDSRVFNGTARADADKDGQPALVEHALGTSDAAAEPRVLWDVTEDSVTVLRSQRSADVLLRALHSLDLRTWSPLPHPTCQDFGDGTCLLEWEMPKTARKGFVRLEASLLP